MTYLVEHIIDVEECKRLIAKTRKDEICILLPNYSINVQMVYDKEGITDFDPEQLQWDLEELSEDLGQFLYVNDYDDLCCDPHGVMNEND